MGTLWEALEASLFRPGKGVIDLSDNPPTEWTRSQLLSLVNHLSTALHEIDAVGGPLLPPILAVYLENSVAAVAAVTAALRSGWAFLPLDPRWPQARLSNVIERLKPAALVCAAPGVPGAAAAAPPPVAAGCTLLRLSAEDLRAARAGPVPDPPWRRPPSPIAYVMMTSGSTGGAPLGVAGTAAGALARCRWAARAFSWRPDDLAAFKTSLSFVDSVAEVLGPLLAGVPLLAVPYRLSVDPGALAAALAAHGATHLTAVPSVWARLAPHLGPSSRLRLAVASGQQLSWGLLAALQGALPQGCTVLNLYGSTEVAGDCAALDCSGLSGGGCGGAVPVGFPLPGAVVALARVPSSGGDGIDSQEIELLDPATGAEGEVVVGGWGLAAGYFPAPPGRRRFVSLPLEALQSRAIRPEFPAGAAPWRWEDLAGSGGAVPAFLTGDRGRTDSQGRLCILGRLDLQVKMCGVRVDLEEVEAALGGHPAVHAVACRAWPRPGSLLVAAYVEWSGSGGDLDDLRAYCAARLPAAAVPGSFQALVALPQSAAGKLDRAALPPPAPQTRDPAETFLPPPKRQKAGAPPLSEVAVGAAFAAALGHAAFEPTDSLFACGGNSLTAVQVADRLKLDVEEVFAAPTVRGLAARAPRATAAAVEDVGNTEAEEIGGAEPAILWRAKMADCVDTPPLCLAATAAAAAAEPAASCWAASHGGTVACYDAATGAPRWQISVAPDQPDPGLALVRCGAPGAPPALAVAANSGAIHLLDAETGQRLQNAIQIDGELRAGPAVDPWAERFGLGLLWAAGHGKALVALAPPPGAGPRAALPLPAAVSAGVTFALEGSGRPTVYVAALDGTLTAVSIDPGPPLQLAPRWEFQCGAPIFGAPAIISGPKGGCSLVVVGTAAGVALAVRGGAAAWRRALRAGPIFAAPLVVSAQKCVFIGTQGGFVLWLSLEDGAELGRRRLPGGAAATALVPCRGGRGLAVATSEGHVLLFDASHPGSAPVACRKLPAPTFAAEPGPRPGTIAVGCRDDHLYLIDFGE